MRQSPRWSALTIPVVAALVLSSALSARATIDLTGSWNVDFATPDSQAFPFPPGVFACPLDFVQAGASLTVTGTCSTPVSSLSLNLSGTIDSVSGAFTVAGPGDPSCSTFTVAATAAADGHSFSSGDILSVPPGYLCSPGSHFGGVFGTRCGNGILEPWEQCEPQGPNDCCNRQTCQFDTGAACDDGNACTTTDQCDATGGCIPGPARVCDTPCEDPVCDPVHGCLAAIDTCTSPTERGSKLVIKGLTHGEIKWSWTKGAEVPLSDFGDPTTTTSYTLCLSSPPPVPRSFLSATAPAGSAWRTRGSGFTFKDKTGTPDGLVSITLKPGTAGRARIKVDGKGPNLDPLFLPLPYTPLIQLKATNGRCWNTPGLVITQNTVKKLQAK